MTAQIEFKGVVFDCLFDYDKGELPTFYNFENTGDLFEGQQVYNIQLFHGGDDFTDLLSENMDEIELLILQKL